ncbi:hypothetical protein FA04_14765 [Ensifer adhaerens]|uniref:Uncharacterized protein n=1 Tax=Ensifer adhaerens TaxID=106592 RepID=A0ABY8HEE5_ENSAD|nr:hypothetical protein [Ensifer adhaerens]ANK73771.1 hypothetical protein FA04_14765 [Ensifer adhaerens]KDP70265.1 hypothetical protein FA04_28930 [Ensifer adhaerens]WFP89859.1 hypothetical protein P4B07_14995 [Ensifer adhaerens]
MSDILSEYADIIKGAQIGCAIRGHMDEGEYLDPALWEELRLRLQSIYRRATGEPMAVLSVDAALQEAP